MKVKILTLTLLLCFSAYGLARDLTVLQCLGKEESYYHKHQLSGPDVELNKLFIEEFSQLPQLSLKYNMGHVCHMGRKRSISYKLLDYFLLYGEEGLNYQRKKYDTEESRDKLFSRTPQWLMTYSSYSKLLYEDPNCLYKRVKELRTLDELLQSPIVHPSIQEQIKDRTFLRKILNKIHISNQDPNCAKKK